MYCSKTQEKKSISYGGWEKDELFDMEKQLQEHYGCNFSQLHKSLVRKWFYALKTAL